MSEEGDAKTLENARQDAREGKAPTTQAGEFIKEEMHHIREGKHGARSTKQAIAIGLSKARRAGVKLPPPGKRKASEKARASAKRAYKVGQGAAPRRKPSAKRSRAIRSVLMHEGHEAASHEALSTQARRAAARRTFAERSAAARKAARTCAESS